MVEKAGEEELLAKLPEEWRDTVQQLVDLKVNQAMEAFEKKYKDQLEALKAGPKAGSAAAAGRI